MTDTASQLPDDKVADALKNSWVYHLPRWIWPYAQLARWERPIGWQLLMWPCWWSAGLAVVFAINRSSDTSISPVPSFQMAGVEGLLMLAGLVLLPLFLGAFLMRGAGCTYNDLADIDIDDQVERTRSRPLPSGRVSKKQAVAFLIAQSLGGLIVLLFLSRNSQFVFWVGCASLIFVAIYPFMKRITWWPQLFLGFAFSWGAFMGWAIIMGSLSIAPLFLYLGSIAWVIGYDTIYAHQDREDDALVGVKSTARLFGEKSKIAISGLYVAALLGIGAAYMLVVPFGLAWTSPAWIALVIGAGQMAWQILKLDIHDGDQCLRLFKSNNQFGLILFAGLAASIVLGGY